MPDNPAGVYTLPPSYKVANGDLTNANQHNPPFEDVEQALTNRLHRDGRTSWTGNQNANGNRITGLADAVEQQDAVTLRQSEGEIGDFKETVRDLSGGRFLRRDGATYDKASYPALAALLPSASSASYDPASIGAGSFISIRRVTPTALIAVTGTTGLNGQVYTATYSSNWTQRTLTGFAINQSTEKSNGAYGNGIYMVNGHDGSLNQKVWTSSSLAGTWSVSGTIVSGGVSGPLCFFDGYFYLVHMPTAAGVKIYRSTNGSSWTAVYTAGLSASVDIQANDNEIVMIQADGSVVRSTNGTSWTTGSIPVSGRATSLAWSDTVGRWAIGTSNATVYTSSTGASWESRSLPSFNGDIIVSDAAPGFVAVPNTAPFTSVGVSTNGFDFFEVNGPGGAGTVRTVARNAQTNSEFLIGKLAGDYFVGTLTVLEDKFLVPSDNPTYGWIKAL